MLDVLIEGEFTAKLHAVAAVYVADLVAGEIEVSAGNRSGNGLRKREVTGCRDLGQRGRSLHIERRSKIAQRGLRRIEAASKVAPAADPKLVGHAGTNCEGVDEVYVLLPPVVSLGGAGNISSL